MSKRIGTIFGRDPARVRRPARRVDLDPGLLGELPGGRGAVGLLALAVAGVDRAAGEDPDPWHEARLGVALDQQHLQAPVCVLAPAAQKDHGRRRAGGCRVWRPSWRPRRALA